MLSWHPLVTDHQKCLNLLTWNKQPPGKGYKYLQSPSNLCTPEPGEVFRFIYHPVPVRICELIVAASCSSAVISAEGKSKSVITETSHFFMLNSVYTPRTEWLESNDLNLILNNRHLICLDVKYHRLDFDSRYSIRNVFLCRQMGGRREGEAERGVIVIWRAGSQVEMWPIGDMGFAAWLHQWLHYP